MDKAAREREEVILKQLEEKEPLPDKEKDQIAWVRAANQHRAFVEEIILKELIYVCLLYTSVFLILGIPIGICLGLSSICAILYSGTSLTIVATNMYSGISKFLLLAIPFFVLSGNIMAKAGISKRLIRFVDTCVGHTRGGIAIVCVIVALSLIHI